MNDARPTPSKPPPRRGMAQVPIPPADPIAVALSRAYAATLAEPLPPSLTDLLRSLE